MTPRHTLAVSRLLRPWVPLLLCCGAACTGGSPERPRPSTPVVAEPAVEPAAEAPDGLVLLWRTEDRVELLGLTRPDGFQPAHAVRSDEVAARLHRGARFEGVNAGATLSEPRWDCDRFIARAPSSEDDGLVGVGSRAVVVPTAIDVDTLEPEDLARARARLPDEGQSDLVEVARALRLDVDGDGSAELVLEVEAPELRGIAVLGGSSDVTWYGEASGDAPHLLVEGAVDVTGDGTRELVLRSVFEQGGSRIDAFSRTESGYTLALALGGWGEVDCTAPSVRR